MNRQVIPSMLLSVLIVCFFSVILYQRDKAQTAAREISLGAVASPAVPENPVEPGDEEKKDEEPSEVVGNPPTPAPVVEEPQAEPTPPKPSSAAASPAPAQPSETPEPAKVPALPAPEPAPIHETAREPHVDSPATGETASPKPSSPPAPEVKAEARPRTPPAPEPVETSPIKPSVPPSAVPRPTALPPVSSPAAPKNPAPASSPASAAPRLPESSFATVGEGETLEAVARRIYGSEAHAEALWRVNRDLLPTRQSLPKAGATLRTPEL